MHGMKAFMIAPTAIIKGIGMHIDFDIFDVEGATGWYNSNYNNKLESAESIIRSGEYDFGFVHIKAVDDAGHDKDADLKVTF
jgi:2,3-bisphosphoglycerate-independent phosphoglycerate mutase